MKRESLLGISVELIETVAIPGAYPADARIGRFFRARRFLGSKDRRRISELVYGWLRYQIRGRLRWRQIASAVLSDEKTLPSDETIAEWEALLGSQDPEDEDPGLEARKEATSSDLRAVYLLDLLSVGADDVLGWEQEELVGAAQGLATPLGKAEWLRQLIEKAVAPGFTDGIGAAQAALTEDAQLAAQYSLPPWLAKLLRSEAGDPSKSDALAASLLSSATLDLRVNLMKKARDKVKDHLERDTKKPVELTPHSHLGLRIHGRVNLTQTMASRNGWIEIQDEGSQIAALCTDVRLGMNVLDACAGNGGKTLALMDIMFRSKAVVPRSRDEGKVTACDIVESKLLEYQRRANESGLKSRIHVEHIYPAGPLPDSLQPADLVLVDAPCTGLGTLRRNPELKRRYREEDVAEFAETQFGILDRFRGLVKPGGVLAYVTCSFLRGECEDVATRFSESCPDFIPYASLWAKKNLPESCIDGHKIRLDPVTTGTDAFFIACWERKETT